MFSKAYKINELKKSLGTQLKALRKNAKLTQQELADELNISKLTIINIEQGKNFTINNLLKMLNHFDQLHLVNEFIVSLNPSQPDHKSLY